MVKRALPVMIGVWSVLVLCGSYSIWSYSATAGTIGDSPDLYPSQVAWFGDEDFPVVVMFAHPKCPCTKASITEFESIMRTNDTIGSVVFWQPQNADEDWSETDLIQSVTDSPWLRPILDSNAEIASAFDAQTSGMCVAYDKERRLVFRGGLTPARGHEGATTAHKAIEYVLRDEPVPQALRQYPVYGCPIQSPGNDQTTRNL